MRKFPLLAILFLLFACAHTSYDKLIDHYDELDLMTQKYFDVESEQTITGKEVQVKVLRCFRYQNEGRECCVYSFLIAPVFVKHNSITGFHLESIEYPKEAEPIFKELNHFTDNTGKLRDYYDADDQRVTHYQFLLNRKYIEYKAKEIPKQVYDSATHEMKLTIKINGRKEVLEIHDITLFAYDPIIDKDNIVINSWINGQGWISISDYQE